MIRKDFIFFVIFLSKNDEISSFCMGSHRYSYFGFMVAFVPFQSHVDLALPVSYMRVQHLPTSWRLARWADPQARFILSRDIRSVVGKKIKVSKDKMLLNLSNTS